MTEFVALTSLPSVHATVLAGALQAEGLTVLLDRPALATVYGLENGVWATQVLVPADQLGRARELLGEFEED